MPKKGNKPKGKGKGRGKTKAQGTVTSAKRSREEECVSECVSECEDIGKQGVRYYLTCTAGNSDKFYEVSVNRFDVLCRYGRSGLEGITSVKSFANSQEVDKFIAKTILEKFRKGYIEQNIVSSPVASSSSPVPSLKKKSKNDAPIEIGNIFSHKFLDKFWDLSLEPSVKEVITTDTVAETEATLGYKFPSAYIELMSSRNGGWPKNTVCSVMNDESQNRHIESFIGIGSSGDNLTHASRNWLDEWEYPKIGVYFGNCPSGGHDLIAMDYTECGPQGEPRIVQVDQEGDFEITFLANNIEEFIRKLRTEVYDDEEEVDGFQVVNSLENVPAKGAMSTSTKLFKSGGSSCSIS